MSRESFFTRHALEAVPHHTTVWTSPVCTLTKPAGASFEVGSFEVGSGEILGITGLPGNGYEEIPYLVTGARRAAGGELRTRAGTVRLARASVAA